MKSEVIWDDPGHRYALYKGHRLPVFHAEYLRRDGDSNVILEPWKQYGKEWAEALANTSSRGEDGGIGRCQESAALCRDCGNSLRR